MGHIRQGDDVLVAAHGNSLRAIITQLDNLKPEQVPGLELDTGVPMVYTFDGKGSVPQKTVLQK